MNDRSIARLGRLAPLAGLAYALLVAIGDMTIGKFPDSNTSTHELASFYAAHHAQVAAGGMIFAWATILLAVFGCTLWARAREAGAHAAVAAAVLVGTAVAVVGDVDSASAYWNLGHISTETAITPSALQAWHVAGSEGGLSGGMAILLLAVAAAGLLWRAVPRWLAVSAGLLGLLQLTPVGFLASLLFLLWAAVTGVVLVVRPAGARARVRGAEPATALSK